MVSCSKKLTCSGVFFFLKEPPSKQGDSVGSLCRHPHPCPSCRSVWTTHGHVQVFTLLRVYNHNPNSLEVPQLLLFSSQKLPSFSSEEALQHFEQHFEEPSKFPPQEGTVKLFWRANPKAQSVVLISGGCRGHVSPKKGVLRDADS